MKKARKPVRKAAKKAAAARSARSKPQKKSTAAKKVAPVPKGYHTATPYLVCRGAAEAIEFYKKAFGAREILRMAMPDGRIGHAEIQIGDSRVMLGDESPEMGARAPMDMFWGDRYCKVQDPFGHKWNMATHIEDLTPKEMARRGAEAMAKPQG